MYVNGKMKFDVLVDVDVKSEELGLLQANYKYHPELIVGYELVAIDCKGNRHKVIVNECEETILDEYVV